ncbi:Chromosome-partitioning protein ParB [Roseivivax sp. THAF40]|uniref:ParB/RepB/Spo0J family partition protein n=1 Tax=unclassified Roseivivax TaxID=2639302 RepID=UPI0012683159|nr:MULTISPECIES: ParB/RepB/Spo0J family partition protein [unclassified Roseivivax]QFS84723.1 Chromosome-partitioning protein ParB [Roseivivax sp. THAF197b]QFT48550.1 Chromosome-partitioning protein ParB [Roseivivax sp. THAF40]
MVEKRERRGLGRGLSALMADVEPQPQADAETSVAARADRVVPIDQIVPNPDQPRRRFSEEQLDELTESIRAKGIIQPIIVREKPDAPNQFEIVAGERRWRAAQRAQLHEIPVLVREFSDTEVLEVAIIENIQRADLNAIEEAAGFRQLMFKFGHTQEKLAEALGKSRSHIANLMRLLNLPEDVQTYVSEGRLSAGHARALITASDPSALAKTVIARNLSVRETEKLAKGEANRVENRKPRSDGKAIEKDADTRALENDLSAALGMKISIDHKPGAEGGRLTISYDTLDQLDALCGILST